MPYGLANVSLVCSSLCPHVSCNPPQILTLHQGFSLILSHRTHFLLPQRDPAIIYLFLVPQLCSHSIVLSSAEAPPHKIIPLISRYLMFSSFLCCFHFIFEFPSLATSGHSGVKWGIPVRWYPLNKINPNKGIWVSQFSMLLHLIAFSTGASGFAQHRAGLFPNPSGLNWVPAANSTQWLERLAQSCCKITHNSSLLIAPCKVERKCYL